MQSSQPNEIDVSMGQVIRRHRKNAGLSQTELGKRAGISVQQMQKYEVGVNRVSISRLFMLAESLDVHPYRLIAEVESALSKNPDAPDPATPATETGWEILTAILRLEAGSAQAELDAILTLAKQAAK